MVRDSLASALHGRSPSFSEDNLLQLRAGDESRSIPLSLVIAVPRFEDTATSLWFLFDSFLYHLSQTASLAARKLTSCGFILSRFACPLALTKTTLT